MSNDKRPIIGIDLGTIHSCDGIIRNGRVEIILEDHSEKKIYHQLYVLLLKKL